jgi:hypothetical protein
MRGILYLETGMKPLAERVLITTKLEISLKKLTLIEKRFSTIGKSLPPSADSLITIHKLA